MKSISGSLATHLAQSCTTLATLWKVKRLNIAGGPSDPAYIILGFTDHDQNITYNDGVDTVTYVAATGFTPSAMETNSDLAVDNLQVSAFLEVDAISDSDLRAGVYDFSVLEIRIVNYKDLTQGDLKMRTGTVGNVVISNGVGQFEIRGLMYRATLPIGQLFGPACRAELGDAQCKIDLSLWNQNGSTLSSTDKRTFIPSSSPTGLLMVGSATPTTPAPAGWFNQGVVTWLSGPNLGYSMEVSTWDGSQIILFENMQYAISPGDTFLITPGCDLTTGPNGCGKYNNIVNYRGEPFIPGQDQTLIYPNSDGSVPG